MSRPLRIAASFAIVMIAYWAYALLAVPWIEPPAAPQPGSTRLRDETAEDMTDIQIRPLRPLFHEGDWQITNPKILESDKAKLLFLTYRNFADGRVEIKPCTIVVPYEGPGDEEQRIRRSIVLDAPHGAVLQFDEPLDLTHAKVGRLVGGQLNGEVVVRSHLKGPGPEDDLKIETRDVELTPQTITTPHPVEFSWGANRGRGRDMVVRLLTDPTPVAGGMNILGIESFELRHVEYLHLELDQAMAAEGAGGKDKTSGPEGNVLPFGIAGGGKAETTPIGVCCQGPFHFDVARRVATFQDEVQVTRLNAGGPPDSISCQLLSLYFAARKSPSPAGPAGAQRPGSGPSRTRRHWGRRAPPPAPSLDLTAERIEAQGSPAVLTAPSQAVTARGPRMEYNLLTKSIAIDGGPEVFLQQGSNEIHAAALRYEAAEPGRLGRVAAQGPGWLRGQLSQSPAAPLVAAWKGQLQVYPDGSSQIVAFTGGAELSFQGIGQLQAPEIFLWLAEVPPAAPGASSGLRPDRMLARNAVHIASPQLSGNVEQLEVWFAESGGRGAPREERGTGDGNPGAAGAGRGTSDVGQGNPAAVPFASPAPASNSRQHFEIAGRVLRARVLLDGPNSGLSHLEVEDGVQFRETQTSQPGQRPLLVRGDRLEIAEASGPKTKITILGRFARFEARGLGLTGTNIHFDRGGNTVRIDGPGQMDLPMAGGLTGQGDTPGGTATVDWQGGMLFDGQTAKFTGGVVAASPNQKLWTDSMDVQLERGVHFSEATPAGAPPQVEAVRCFGGVRMENQTRDPQGQLTALDRMHVSDIDVNLLTGALNGGPGELVSVRHGSDRTPGAMPFGQNVALRRPPSAAGGPLKCLHVVWQGAMVGNVKSRTLRFRDQVQAGYAPVDEWERSIPLGNPDQLGPDGATVNCGQLTVAETITPLDSKKSIELEALGNAQAENATFKAVANRITYAEAKDLLILEGDGRSDANLFRQDRPGDPPTTLTAQKVWFWPKTNRCKIENPKALQIIQFQPGKS